MQISDWIPNRPCIRSNPTTRTPHLLTREIDMGMMEKMERANVMTPIMSPPVRRFTQQQQLLLNQPNHQLGLRHGYLSTLFTNNRVLRMLQSYRKK